VKFLFLLFFIAARPPFAGAAPFVIGAMGGPPAAFNTEEIWRVVQQGNFNLITNTWQKYDAASCQIMLTLGNQLGLNVIVHDEQLIKLNPSQPEWKHQLTAIVANYKNQPGLVGLDISDEPSATDFSRLGKILRQVQAELPGKIPFINLLPIVASKEQLGGVSYEQYLEDYIAQVRPPVISFDIYPEKLELPAGYKFYENLEMIRRLGLKYDIPVWAYVKDRPPKDPTAAPPDETSLRWQIFTYLAYGYKGILYFTLWSPSEKIKAIIGPDGKPTDLYPDIQKINYDVGNLAKTLVNLTSDGVYQTGYEIPWGTQALKDDLDFSLEPGTPMTVGSFHDSNGNRYIMIVNRDRWTKQSQAPIELYFKNTDHVSEISASDGLEHALPATGINSQYLQVTLQLKPGEGKLLRYR